jgi:hypothetical protein
MKYYSERASDSFLTVVLSAAIRTSKKWNCSISPYCNCQIYIRYIWCVRQFRLEISNKWISRQMALYGHGWPMFVSEAPPLDLGNASDVTLLFADDNFGTQRRDFAHDVYRKHAAGTPFDVARLLHTSCT